jgi:hypothetical protein
MPASLDFVKLGISFANLNLANLANLDYANLPNVDYANLPSPAELKGIQDGVQYAQGVKRQQALERSSGGLWSGTTSWDSAHKWGIMAVAEVGLGLLSLTPIGSVADATFAVGMAMSAVTTAHSCASGQTGSCAFGILSLGLGGASFAVGRVANALSESTDAAGFIRRPILQGAAFVGDLYGKVGSGSSLVMSGLSDLPCGALQTRGC